MTGLNQLQRDGAGEKRLQRYFDDRRIRYGENNRTHQKEVWYVPANSRPYRVCTAQNPAHALKQLQARSYADKMHARQLLAEVDAHNEKLQASMHEDAMGAVKSDLAKIARGRQTFMAR